MKALFFGSYHQNYSRNRIILKGLQANSIEVIHCNIFNVRSFKRKWLLLKKALNEEYNIIFIGFPASILAMPIALLLKCVKRKKIVYDPLISQYNTKVNDYHMFPKHSLRGNILRFVENLSFNMADVLISDTKIHGNYFSEEIQVPKSKIHRVFVGSDYEKENSISKSKTQHFQVTFFGSYIPLQGIPIIFQAAKILLNQTEIHFKIIGGNPKKILFREMLEFKLKNNLNNVEIIPFMQETQLINELNRADIILGIFGNSIKSQIVIPNKIYAAIALEKAIISSNHPAIRELFTNGHNAILCKAEDPESLANSILTLYTNSILRTKIAHEGYKTYLQYCTPKKIGNQLKKIFRETLQK
ncbi:hypothetical protein NEF87_004265 [Candidatus Lokiarchaeum ossiferum]|uniref:Glycosyl transferase family 1 domain-containing protein n=1 Tax=Candidatus Lokiarchaeum ossiferum TaxID=2951803 RepID=A0ABY6HWS1_9ARCH|nr:hypothetical protein NEF87_004265 [Candidatus Lokiarchaeum sp. B-35]